MSPRVFCFYSRDDDGKLCEKPLDNANILGKFFASTFVQESQDSDFITEDKEHTNDINDISYIEFCVDEVKRYLSNSNIYIL